MPNDEKVSSDNNNQDMESLHSAVKLGNLELLEKLLIEKVDVNSLNQNSETPLHIAIKHGRSKRIASLLIQNGADMNAKDRDGLTPLHLAAHSGNTAFVRILLRHNAPIDDFTNNPNRETALHLATRSGHLGTIKCLLDHGADINAKTDNEIGLTVLHHSSACAKTTKLLLDSGIKVNSLDNLNNNALHKVCTWGYERTAQVLVDYGIDVNAMNSKGSTALDIIHSVIWRIRKRGWFVNPGSAPEKTALVVIKMLAKKIASNEYVNDIDSKLLSSEELRGLYRHCTHEMEKMRDIYIYDGCTVTFCDILTKNVHNTAKFLNNVRVMRKLESRDFEEKFPVYANILRKQIVEATEMYILVQLSGKSLSTVLKHIFPTLIIHEILSYLDADDLKIFLEACGQHF